MTNSELTPAMRRVLDLLAEGFTLVGARETVRRTANRTAVQKIGAQAISPKGAYVGLQQQCLEALVQRGILVVDKAEDRDLYKLQEAAK